MKQVVISRLEVFIKLVKAKKIGGSYRKNIKQKVTKGLPKMTCAVLVEDKSQDPPVYEHKENLKTIPANLWKNKLDGNRK